MNFEDYLRENKPNKVGLVCIGDFLAFVKFNNLYNKLVNLYPAIHFTAYVRNKIYQQRITNSKIYTQNINGEDIIFFINIDNDNEDIVFNSFGIKPNIFK